MTTIQKMNVNLLCTFCVITILALLIQIPFSTSSNTSDLFENWCKKHGKVYSSEQEKQYRLKVFEDNYEFVLKHNSVGNSSYTLSVNGFADLTHHEFRTKYLGLSSGGNNGLIRMNDDGSTPSTVVGGGGGNVPSSVDWRTKGAVTLVKDQGSCGACWAFAATGAMESINEIFTGSLVSLSEQELIDCDRTYNSGCSGGLMDYAYAFVKKNGGIDTEEDYPYKGLDGTCNKGKLNKNVVTIDGYKDVPPNNEEELLKAVVQQPVSVGICGSERAFQLYSKGIFTGPCSANLDHAVLIVGYDSANGVDYWMVKNSWGTLWGMNGYAYMVRNTGTPEGICGINMLASYPVKTSPNPPPTPAPTKCSIFATCGVGETCCCSWSILGICFSWKCCGAESAVCCKDNLHCCPHDYPICDTTRNLCFKQNGNATLVQQPPKKGFSANR